MGLADVVTKLARPRTVIRRAALTFDGSSPFPATESAETTAIVYMAIQRGDPTTLVRSSDGDESTGTARVWVTEKALLAAVPPTSGSVALAWTSLQIAPPEETDGPPGDIVVYDGRRWEITQFQGWAEGFRGAAGFQRYLATDRGAA